MKQLLVLLCAVFFLCSCSISKKTANKTQSNIDSSVTKNTAITNVKKSDSTGKEKTQATEKQRVESGYKKTTTTVVEWFSDEFGDDEAIVSVDTPKVNIPKEQGKDSSKAKRPPWVNSQGKRPANLVKRSTTTTEEEGFKNASNEAEVLNEKTGTQNSNDSLSADHNEQANKKASQKDSDSKEFRFGLLPPWVLFLLIILLVGGLYVKYKFF